MKQVMSPAFRIEASQHQLVTACEHCAHFVFDAVERVAGGTGAPGACDLLFPTGPHRRAAWQALHDGEALPFCKMFEADRGDAVVDRTDDVSRAGAADRPAPPDRAHEI
jgi:hypothetical protein